MTSRRCSNCLHFSILLAALVPLLSSAEQTEPKSNDRYLIYVTNEISGDGASSTDMIARSSVRFCSASARGALQRIR